MNNRGSHYSSPCKRHHVSRLPRSSFALTSMGKLLRQFGRGALLVLFVSMTNAFAEDSNAVRKCRDPDMTIDFALEPDRDASNQFALDMLRAIHNVCKWWGATYDGPFRIFVRNELGPSMALVPAWRGGIGDMLFSAPMVARGKAATVHEVVHIYAPNGNRFLAEGLAVFAHERLNGPPAYPNFGGDLHRGALRMLRSADVITLEGIETPTPLRAPGIEMQDAYIVAGSFVRFLVEKYGLDRFRALYAMTPFIPGKRIRGDVARWRTVYGKDLEVLETEWKEFLRSR